MSPWLLKPSRSKFIRDLNRKATGLGRVVRIMEYEPMAAKAVQEQIHKGLRDLDRKAIGL